MDESNKHETLAEFVDGVYENSWNETVDRVTHKLYEDVENGVLEALDIWVAKGEIGMAKLFTILAAKDENETNRRSGKFLGRKKLAEKLGLAVIDYLRNNCGAAFQVLVPDIEPIIIDSDEDEGESTARPDVREGSSTARRSRTQSQRKQTHDSDSDAPLSRHKRARRGDHHPNSSASQQMHDSTDMRTIYAWELEDTLKDFVFPCPAVGSGYYILRCGSGKTPHCFDQDPLSKDLGSLGIKHFNVKAPSRKCHKWRNPRNYDEEEMVREFGYKVIDSDGDDIDENRAKNINELAVRKADQLRTKSKGKQKATAPPPAAPRGIPPIHMGPASRDPPSPLYRSETAHPRDENTAPLIDGPRAPVPDMNSGLSEAYQAQVGHGNPANQQENDADAMLVDQVVNQSIADLRPFSGPFDAAGYGPSSL